MYTWWDIMGQVIKFKKSSLVDKGEGRTLCDSGFHKWTIMQDKQFDVKQGKLVTVYRCKRCGEIKVQGALDYSPHLMGSPPRKVQIITRF